MKRLFLSALLVPSLLFNLYSKDYKISSPDGKIAITVSAERAISWKVLYEGNEIISSPRIAMELAGGRILGVNESVRRSLNGKYDDSIKPVVPVKNSLVRDNYNYLRLMFRSGLAITFRAYNDGIAYRFETSLADSVTVINEVADIGFPPSAVSWFPYEKSFMSHNENSFIYSSLDTITNKHLASLPVLFKTGDVNVLVAEASIEDYPGMWLRGAGNGRLTGTWPRYPESERLFSDRNLNVTRTKDYIARCSGTRTFPWRAFVIAGTDAELIESELIFRLAEPSRVADTDWIKPGKVAWDWWNANNIYGVDFRAGLNNDTYKYFIDFASANGIEYVILDEGWYRLGNLLEQAPGFDVGELCRYAESKDVGIILWVVWKTFDDQMDKALEQFSKWGVKGIKVDFMQRDDQKMVRFYYKAAARAADYKMLIDFHGSYKPDGFGRTFPNALTREGVKGMEHSKWSRDVDPEHDVTIPFTRMVAGPMDYTPGAMVNMEKQNFHPLFTRPASQGTRVHQMAMYVVFESPLQMISDNPANLMKEQECTDFIVKVPVTWDETRVLRAKTGDYVLLARRSGNEWFAGALTDWTARDLELDLSFLGNGNYVMEIFRDGINADRYAIDYKHLKQDVTADMKINIRLAPGGGWVAKITPK